MPISPSASVIRAILRPEILARAFLRKFAIGSYEFRLALDAVPRPWYGYSIQQAARLADRLGIPEIVVIELGVAMGDGLAEMARIAQQFESICKTRIRVVGFDAGIGMPEYSTYRDLPYIWRRGHYRMDEAEVRRRIGKAELILGDVAETVPRFLSTLTGAAISGHRIHSV